MCALFQRGTTTRRRHTTTQRAERERERAALLRGEDQFQQREEEEEEEEEEEDTHNNNIKKNGFEEKTSVRVHIIFGAKSRVGEDRVGGEREREPGMGDIARLTSQRWNALGEEEKRAFKEK